MSLIHSNQSMHHRTIWLFVVLFAAIVIGMFTYAYLERKERTAQVAPVINSSSTPLSTPLDQRVNAKHYYIDGTHSFAGIVSLPTPCDLLEATARVAESFPEQIIIDFTTTNNSESCIQVVSEQRFLVSAQASSEARISATWNGQPIELNLTPAAPGERPEDFEVFVKG